ncbi:hypothetical protein ATG66_3883 [Vibrio sp. ES.051]|uniref:Der GTPase-activating protein YihI n=1 Tax=Vibrio sp. ES.051 TaxID=1761909 RepID=UPI000BF45FB3|nr:Der GTPase-activating protein YihI [Vibrio sp. ES.051]PFG45589.1 hypothetical protein ATG66_3883 [Vibrio sp. ES.051]
MSRTKKSRKPGAAGAPEPVVTRNRTESDVEGRLRKRAKKRKGLQTGNRNTEANEKKKQTAAQNRDPRLGSKKKIPLVVEPAKKMTKQERRLSAEQELEMLENDAQLNVLLDRIEAGESLGTGLQKYVDEKLNRIEKLMDQLGLLEPEEDEDFTAPAEKSARNDDDLLADFDDINFDDYKG